MSYQERGNPNRKKTAGKEAQTAAVFCVLWDVIDSFQGCSLLLERMQRSHVTISSQVIVGDNKQYKQLFRTLCYKIWLPLVFLATGVLWDKQCTCFAFIISTTILKMNKTTEKRANLKSHTGVQLRVRLGYQPTYYFCSQILYLKEQ